jgi:hypothetical protein
VGLRHRAEDLPRRPAARTDQDLDGEHPAQKPGPGPARRELVVSPTAV